MKGWCGLGFIASSGCDRTPLSSFCQCLHYGSSADVFTLHRMFNLAFLKFNKYHLHNKHTAFTIVQQPVSVKSSPVKLTYVSVYKKYTQGHNTQNLYLTVIKVSVPNAEIRDWIYIKCLYHNVYHWCINENVFIFWKCEAFLLISNITLNKRKKPCELCIIWSRTRNLKE